MSGPVSNPSPLWSSMAWQVALLRRTNLDSGSGAACNIEAEDDVGSVRNAARCRIAFCTFTSACISWSARIKRRPKSLGVFAVAQVDLSTIDGGVRDSVTYRGLYLVSLDEDPEDPRVFVCTDPDPEDIGYTMRGHVICNIGSEMTWYTVYGMNGRMRMGGPEIDKIPGMFPSWEAGIWAVLNAFDQYSGSTHY
ncbi:hypothetical protein [Streptomyces sp. NPDC056323]|uniref:hypothetical protein n=1 Tax=Streptomyces sp. NPDC056323 TaxID=3345784 RepID=UPI0035D64EBB